MVICFWSGFFKPHAQRANISEVDCSLQGGLMQKVGTQCLFSKKEEMGSSFCFFYFLLFSLLRPIFSLSPSWCPFDCTLFVACSFSAQCLSFQLGLGYSCFSECFILGGCRTVTKEMMKRIFSLKTIKEMWCPETGLEITQ